MTWPGVGGALMATIIAALVSLGVVTNLWVFALGCWIGVALIAAVEWRSR